MKKQFKIGDMVEAKISSYPYIRVGKIVRSKYKTYWVKVEYTKRYSILKKTAEQIEKVIQK